MSFDPPRMPCAMCGRRADEHANDRCLFQSTKYTPIGWGEFYAWAIESGTAEDPKQRRRNPDCILPPSQPGPLRVVLVDQGVTYAVMCSDESDEIHWRTDG